MAGQARLTLPQMSNILFGDTMVPVKRKIVFSFWGIVFYMRTIILLGSATKKNNTQMVVSAEDGSRLALFRDLEIDTD